MHSIDPLHPAQSSTLWYLGEHPGAKLEDISEFLTTQGTPLSRAQLYKLLSKLLEEQVLYREKGKYTLHSAWLGILEEFMEHVQTHRLPPHVDLKEGERSTFYGTSLADLDYVWNHLMAEFTAMEKPERVYLFNSHSYYEHASLEVQTRLYTTMGRHQAHMRFLFGHETFLDRKGAALLERDPFIEAKCNKTAPFPKEGYMVNIINDIIIEFFIPKEILSLFAFYEEHITEEANYRENILRPIFFVKQKCSLTVRRDKKNAERIRDIIDRYY